MKTYYGPSLKKMNKGEIKSIYINHHNNDIDPDSVSFTVSIAISGLIGSFIGSYLVSALAKCGDVDDDE